MAISIPDSPTTSLLPQTVAHHAVPKPQERTKGSHGPSRFGTLRKLPAEVRLHIWHYLMPEFLDNNGPSPSREAFGSPVLVPAPRLGNCLAILRTSRALKKEIEAELYRLRTLTFTIRPEWRGWRVENLPGSTMTDFAHTKFARFESIKVDIYCPQRDDPGQLLYARASVLNLVRLLLGEGDNIEQCEPYNTRNDQKQLMFDSACKCDNEIPIPCAQIPRMEVTFLDEGLNTWYEDGSPHRTFWFGYDLGILVAAFGYLHKVQGISFTFPEAVEPDSLLDKTVRSVVERVSSCPIWRWNSNREEIENYLFLDWALDTAPGPAAAILRRERLIYSRWYRRSVENFLDAYLDRREYHNEYALTTSDRYRDFQNLDRSYLEHGWKLEVTQDPKWLEEWRNYWPSGIPPKGSPEWNALIASASRF
ncbi:MAG: hypothetical protein Q9195_002343 [Heterodermia aff. obscurata]